MSPQGGLGSFGSPQGPQSPAGFPDMWQEQSESFPRTRGAGVSVHVLTEVSPGLHMVGTQ